LSRSKAGFKPETFTGASMKQPFGITEAIIQKMQFVKLRKPPIVIL